MVGVTVFHPDFPSSHPLGGAIIECGSGVSFRFPPELLSISTPFADAAHLSALSQANEDKGSTSEERIILSNVPFQGFHMLLVAIHPITSYHTISTKTTIMATKTVEMILEGYYTAEVLDIPYPTFSRLLIPCFPDPFVKFALSTAISPAYGSAEDRDLIQETVVGTFNSDFHSLSRFAELLMIELNPHYHVRLRRLLRARRGIPPSLQSAMRTEPTPDGLDDFSKKCINLPCPAIQSVQKKSWTQLRSRASSFVWEALREERVLPGERCKIADGVIEEACMGCPRCFERLSAAIGKAINDMEAQLPTKV
jgi:hypothetical protein